MPGLLALAAIGGVYDAWAIATSHETISSAFWRLRRKPLGRIVLAACGAVLIDHLWGGQ